MVHLITLNPAIDEFIELDDFLVGKTNYRQTTKRIMGGKAVNVAIVLNNLGADYKLVTAVDMTNNFIMSSLANLNSHLINVENTRVNLKINSKGETTEINDKGNPLSVKSQDSFVDYITTSVKADDIVLIAGNPHNQDINFQFDLAKFCKSLRAKLVLDSNRFNLEMIKELKPLMVKPNDEELEALFETNDSNYLIQGKELAKYSSEVIISHGGDGLTFINSEEVIEEDAIKGKVINTVGAGDSLVAGYIYASVNNYNNNDKVKFAKYTASASVFNDCLATKQNIKAYDTDSRFDI